MRMIELHPAKDYAGQRRKRRIWKRIVAGLACVVVFSTTYMLILPAVTEEKPTFCGIEEHRHDANCYEHRLVCPLEEASPHVHSETCYEQQETLICGQEETVGGHIHSPECYQAEEALTCGQEENEGHTHTEQCYEDVLVCEKEEHTHSLACFSDPNADIETQSDWEKTISDVDLSGVWADDVLAIARTQLGYQESTQNYVVTEAGQQKGWTRYGAWYGNAYGDWCAMFASFCLHYAGIDSAYIPFDASCPSWIDKLSSESYQLYHAAESDYIPSPGDLIFFDWDEYDEQTAEMRIADHVGLVDELIYDKDESLAELKIIEGNSDNRVQYITYKFDDPTILGYGELPEKPVEHLPDTADDMSDAVMPQASINAMRENVTTVKVTKKWRGAASARPDSVTVHLFQNGTKIQSTILNADNSWNYTFESLPYHDDAGNVYTYTISEDSIEGFFTTYSDVSTIVDSTAGTHYVKAENVETGKNYIMVGRGYGISAYLDKDGKTVKASGDSVTVSEDKVVYDGTTYYGEITDDVPDGTMWTVTPNADGTYTFRCGDYYLLHKDDSVYLAKSISDPKKESSSFDMDADGYISFLKNGKDTKYVNVAADKNGFKQLEKKDKKSDAAPFVFYEKIDVLGAYDKYEYTVTNTYMNGGTTEESTVTGSKYIDYLGDDGNNPDTTLSGDFYRQYLDMAASGDSGVDFLFVVDTTGSMTNKFGVDEAGNSVRRDQTVSRILNGADGAATEDGLLTQLLRANPNNHAAVVTFCGQVRRNDITYNQAVAAEEVRTQLDWVSLDSDSGIAPYANVLHTDGYGTCYAIGVVRAAEFMQSDEILDDGNRKVVVFLGDGEPNAIITGPDGNGGFRYTAATVEELKDKDNISFNWKPSSAAYNTRPTVDYLIESTKDLLPEGQEHIDIYSVSVGYDRTGDSDILGYMAEQGGGKKFVVNSPSETVSAFREIISNYFATGAKITDNISQYAELYTNQLDFQISRVRISDGQQAVIWQGALNSDGTIGSAVNGGASYVKAVTYQASSSADSTGTVTVTFQPSYVLEPGIKYVVSYNLKATETAKELYNESKAYNSTGDIGTDYNGNTTSSGQLGFRSNQSAILSYSKDGGENASQYPHPVIQVTPNEPTPAVTTLTIRKTVLGAKTADKFPFKAVLSSGSFPQPGEGDAYELDDEGAALFQLGNGDSITLTVPMNAEVAITETSHDGFYPIIKNGQIVLANDDAANVTIGTTPVDIEVVNTAGTELPETGGPGTFLFTLCGLGLMAGALMYRCHISRKRERRAEQS